MNSPFFSALPRTSSHLGAAFLLLAWTGALLAGCGGGSPAPPAPPAGAPAAAALPSAAPELPAELRQLMELQDTAQQLMEILHEPCLGEQAPSNGIYQIELTSPQVKTVEDYGNSAGADVPFQENFQRMAEIIGSGNGHFSQLEAQQLCGELNMVLEGVASMISEASSSEGLGAPGPPGPGGPRPPGPGGPGPGGPGPPKPPG